MTPTGTETVELKLQIYRQVEQVPGESNASAGAKLRSEVDFNHLSGFAARGKFPFGHGIFRGSEQNRAAALGLNGLHVPVRRHDGNHLDGAPEVHLSCDLRVGRGHFSQDFTPALGGSLLALGRRRRSKAA